MVRWRRKKDEIVTRQRKVQEMGFKILFELTKFRIVLLITLSTATGFILAADELSARILVPVFGIFLLVSGSSALNQYQEWKTDALMERTKLRPIPSGKIKPLWGCKLFSSEYLSDWFGIMACLECNKAFKIPV